MNDPTPLFIQIPVLITLLTFGWWLVGAVIFVSCEDFVAGEPVVLRLFVMSFLVSVCITLTIYWEHLSLCP